MQIVTDVTNKSTIWKTKFIDLDITEIVFDLDALQAELLNRYLRQDKNFLRAYYTNYTNLFMQFIRDKARLNEPISLSVMGAVRCQPSGSKVLMANGEWKNIEKIKIGDKIISPQRDGTINFSKVIELNNGYSQIYDIIDKKRKIKLFSCSDNHKTPFNKLKTIGRFRLKNGKRAKPTYIFDFQEFTPIEYSNLRESYIISKSLTAITSPLINSFEDAPEPTIDAYSLGVFIGNGNISEYYSKSKKGIQRSLRITNMDIEPINKINEIYRFMSIQNKKGTNCKMFNWSTKSLFYKELMSFGFKNIHSGEKFIPKKCLFASSKYRKELLAGLIDTDGYLHKIKNQYEYSTKSKQLSEDIKFLVHSLGGYAHIRKVKKQIKSINFEGEYYVINIIIREIIPTQIERKTRKRFNFINHTSNQIRVKFLKSKIDKVYGITIDSPSSWYITDNFMITHNSGKSVSSVTIAGLIMESRGRLMDTNHVCASEFELLNILKNSTITQFGDAFVIDESKQAVFGVGSLAKKFKLSDIQNIIAVNNISTIFIRPDGWSFEGAMYGLRAFGRGQFFRDGKPTPMRINRFMLYNLQESSAGGNLPLGMIYIPHFMDILMNGKQLWEDYSKKKQIWVDAEQKGESDTLVSDMMKVAQKIYDYPKFKLLKAVGQKKTFIQTALGSEATKGEITTIYEMIRLLENGFSLEEIRNLNKMQNA